MHAPSLQILRILRILREKNSGKKKASKTCMDLIFDTIHEVGRELVAV